VILKAAVISRQPGVQAALDQLFDRSQACALVRFVDRYVVGEELRLAVHACAPDVVFVDVDSGSAAIATLRAVQDIFPGLQAVAVANTSDRHILLEMMTLGVREVITDPGALDSFLEMVGRIRERLQQAPVRWGQNCKVISFLPAKPSAGATTLAVHLATALSGIPDTKVLLADLDLNSGIIPFLLQTSSLRGLHEAIQSMPEMNETLWPEFVARKGTLDMVAPLELGPATRIDSLILHQLLNFTRRLYDFVCLDHSGFLEKLSIDMLRESNHIFLICTPEIPSLHLARQRLQLLESLDLTKRVSVLVNRSQKKGLITTETVEKLIGRAALLEFPNDYLGVQRAALDGACCNPESPVGTKVSALVDWLTRRNTPRLAPTQKRRFIQYITNMQGGYDNNTRT
jgi:pilus assembly protein CpaE